MPDAGASRKRQISSWRIPDGLMSAGSGAERASKLSLNSVAGRRHHEFAARWSQMRRDFAACNIADFRAGVGLRRYFGLRGPVEKFRSMEFDLSFAMRVAGAMMAGLFADRSGISGLRFSRLGCSIRALGRREEGNFA
jgi:hypothetical protein